MKTITHICDVCKTSKSESDLARLTVTSRGITVNPDRSYAQVEFDICKDCLKRYGFVVTPPTEQDEEKQMEKQNEKLLREKLLDILTDLDVAFYE